MGQTAPTAPPLDVAPIDHLIGRIAQDGVQTAGRAFVGATPTILKDRPNTMANQSLSEIRDRIAQQPQGINKYANVPATIGKAVVNFAKPGLKNVWGVLTQPFQAVPKVQFQLTHGLKTEEDFYRGQYNDTVNKVNAEYDRLNQDLSSGKINKTEYDKGLKDLNSWSGSSIDAANAKVQDAHIRETGWRDWQTGKYKPNATPMDIFNIIDGGISIASIGTAGFSKGIAMKTAEEGLFKTGGTFFLEQLSRIVGKDAAAEVGLRTLSTPGVSVFTKIDEAIAATIERIPGLREYSDRQIAKLGGDLTAKKFVTNALAETIIHAPLRQMNMESAQTIVTTAMDGTFLKTPAGQHWINSGAAQSIMLAGMALEGGPIGFILKNFKKSISASKIALFGDAAVRELDGVTASNFDHFLRKLSGDANDATIGWKYITDLKTTNPEQYAAVKSIYATWFDPKIGAAVSDAAALGIIKDLTAAGKKVDIPTSFEHMFNWQKSGELAAEATKALQAAGKLEANQQAVAVIFARETQDLVRKDVTTVIKEVRDTLKSVGETSKVNILAAQKQAAIEYISNAQKTGLPWAQHDGLVEDMIKSINEAKYGFNGKNNAEAASIINAIKAKETATLVKGVPSKISKALAERGYYLAVPKNIGVPFKTAAESATVQLESTIVGVPKNGVAEVLGLSKKAKVDELTAVLGNDVAAVQGASPAFGQVGALLQKAGIGLQSPGAEAYKIITTSIAERIDKAGLGVDGVGSLKKLREYADKSRTITDLRQMTKNEIEKALGVSKKAAGEIQKSIIQAHLDVPLEIRGLGDKIIDVANKVNPFQPIYSRIQGAFRYTYNPFFRVQETTETLALSIAKTDGRNAFATTFGAFGGKNKGYLNSIVAKMESFNVLEATQYGEAANTGVVGRVSASLNPVQKRALASVVDDMATKMGMSVEDLLKRNTNDVLDAIRPIVQYPPDGIINSNFMRTLNVAAFPARYNIKVATLAVETLARQTPVVQAAAVTGLLNFSNWLQTDQGLAWRQDYNAEIKAFKWLTPLGNLDWTFARLQGKHNSFSDFGQLGGLPLGVWTQILNDQGIIETQSPYVDVKTGEIYSKRIPDSMKGRMAMALMDMLGSTFTFPGRTLGLPSKAGFTRDAAYRITGASSKDFRNVQYSPSQLDPEQQRAQKFFKDRANANNQPTPTKPTPAPLQTTKLQVSQSGIPLGRHSKSEIAAAKKAGKTKKTKQPVPFTSIVAR